MVRKMTQLVKSEACVNELIISIVSFFAFCRLLNYYLHEARAEPFPVRNQNEKYLTLPPKIKGNKTRRQE